MTICERINCRELILNLNLCFVFNVLYTIGIVYKMRLSNVVYISKILLFCITIYWIWVPGISVTNHSEASSAELCGTNLSILIIPALALEKTILKCQIFCHFQLKRAYNLSTIKNISVFQLSAQIQNQISKKWDHRDILFIKTVEAIL